MIFRMKRKKKIDIRSERKKAQQREEKRAKRLRILKKIFLIFLEIVLCFFILVSCFFLISRVHRNITIGNDETLDISDLYVYPFDNVPLELSDGELNYEVPGKYEICVASWIVRYKVHVTVVDNIPPIFTTKQVIAEKDSVVSADMCIDTIKEASDYEVSFLSEPDMGKFGDQKVVVVVKDIRGNESRAEGELFIPKKFDLILEAGDLLPEPIAFFDEVVDEVRYVDKTWNEPLSVGKYTVRVMYGSTIMNCNFEVRDTSAPKVVTKGCSTYMNKPLPVEAFIESYVDSSKVSFSYEEEPRFDIAGMLEVKISAVDEYLNKSIVSSYVNIYEDNEAPFLKMYEIDTYVGTEKPDYLKFAVCFDDVDERDELSFDIDDSGVDLSVPGDYQAYVTVTDHSLNQTIETTYVHVSETLNEWDDIGELDKMADGILASITVKNESKEEKARMIYYWLRQHVAYTDRYVYGNTDQGAYYGLTESYGNSFVMAATAAKLFERAEIPNIIIERKNVTEPYCWNIIDVGNGYVHFDVSNQDTSQMICMVETERLLEYSSENEGYYDFSSLEYGDILK